MCIAGLTSVMRLRGPASLIDHKGVEVVEAGVSIDNLGCLSLADIGETEAGALVHHEPLVVR